MARVGVMPAGFAGFDNRPTDSAYYDVVLYHSVVVGYPSWRIAIPYRDPL